MPAAHEDAPPSARSLPLGRPALLASVAILVVLAVAVAGLLLYPGARAASLEREAALWRQRLLAVPDLRPHRSKSGHGAVLVLDPSPVPLDDDCLRRGLDALRAKPPSPEALEAADDLGAKTALPVDFASRLGDLLGDERILGDRVRWEKAKSGSSGLVWGVRLSRVGLSRDGRTALLYAEGTLGSLSGSGGLYLYRWDGKEWKLVATVWGWIS